MQRRTLHAALLIFILAISAGVGVLIFLQSGGPLTGVTEHDFKIMLIERGEESVQREHIYVLTNDTDRVLNVEYAKATCGCVSATLDRKIIPPGEQLQVQAKMKLRRAGDKRVAIRLKFSESGEQLLELNGTARREQQVFSIRQNIPMKPGGSTSYSFTVEIYDANDPPPSVEILLTNDLTATFEGWQMTDARKSQFNQPGRWRGQVTLQHSGDVIADDAELSITVDLPGGKTQSIAIPIVLDDGIAGGKRRSLDVDPMGLDGGRNQDDDTAEEDGVTS